MKFKEYITEGINDRGIFKAIFMAGNPGAGKSYTFSKIKSGSVEPRIVNTDKVFPLFKEYWSKDWKKISSKVKIINKSQLALYINSMLPLAVDGTANETNIVLRRLGILESLGYDVGMVFINTSLETSIERASKREREVDVEFIKNVYKQVNQAKSFYRSKFQTWIEIDNNEDNLNNKAIIDAFKFTTSFYNSQLINPIGVDIIERMNKNNWKYLDPNITSLKRINESLNGWYRS